MIYTVKLSNNFLIFHDSFEFDAHMNSELSAPQQANLLVSTHH